MNTHAQEQTSTSGWSSYGVQETTSYLGDELEHEAPVVIGTVRRVVVPDRAGRVDHQTQVEQVTRQL